MNEAQTNSESEQIDDLLVSKEPVTFLSIKERFRSYFSVKSERTARDSYSLIDGRIRYYINKLIDSEADTVYSYKTVGEFMVCLSKLNNDEGYTEDNLRRHHKLSAALSSYLDFLTKNDI